MKARTIQLSPGLDNVRITQTQNGRLECSLDRTLLNEENIWCDHIELVIKDGLDASSLLWQDDENIEADYIWIPIVPSQDLWAECSFLEKVTGGYKFYLGSDLQGEFIGFVGPGEGRLIMREMILNWFEPRVEAGELGPLECKSIGHSFAAQMEWQDALTKEHDALIQKWCVFDTGLCLACKKKEGDMSDLVPSADRTGFPR